jgi:hypothetical protein
MIAAFTNILTNLNACGYAPTLNVIDNECSKADKTHIRTNSMDIHLIPPHNHRVNAAKHAIATFKEHFISALATVDKDCPLQLWDNFLLQVELTLNLIQFSRRDPTKSANEEVNGKFDYNKTPLAPLGNKVLVYDDPTFQASWAPHGTDAYYVGPALKYYLRLQFYMPGIRGYCVADTWHLYPTHCAAPSISHAECTLLEATDILTALGGTVPTSARDSILRTQAIQQLCNILLPTLPPGTMAPEETSTPRVLRSRLTTAAGPRVPEPRVPMDNPSPRATRAMAHCANNPLPVNNPSRTPTTSNDPTTPANIQLLRPIPQRPTHNKNRFTILEDETSQDNNDYALDDITIQASNCSTKQPKSTSTPCRTTAPLTRKPTPIPTPIHNLQPTAMLIIRPPQMILQSVIQKPSTPITTPPSSNKQLPNPTYIPPNDDEYNDIAQAPRHSIRLLSPHRTAKIAIQALYHVINLAFNNPPSYTVPHNFIQTHDQFQHDINIEEVCNGVVHPVTKETITKYTKLMDDSNLKDLWVPAMSKELHRLTQGKEMSLLVPTQISILPMTKSGTFLKLKLSLTNKLLLTTAPKRTTRIESESLSAGTSLITIQAHRRNSRHGICKNYVEQCD